MRAQKVTGLAAFVLVAAGISLAGAQAAHANTLATPSFGAANSVSYADSDFETSAGAGSVGDWVNVANSTLSADTTSFLHGHALKAVAGTTAAMQYKLGNAQQVNVNASSTWTVGAYFKAPALSGRTITFAIGFFNSSNTFIGWTSATAVTLSSSGSYQYVQSDITAPATAAYMLGSPRVTENGQAAGEALHMDELWLHPQRPALMIGADAGSGGDASLWSSADSSIGPLQEDKIFYSGAVPSSYTGSTCAALPASVTCVIAYKTQTTNLASYISGIPASRNVIFVYHQEPENGDYTSGATFVSEFEGQANAIRADAAGAPNIFVSQDSSSSGYGSGKPGADCSYVVPSSYTDFYAVDHYEFNPNGGNFATGQHSDTWNAWLNCVETGSPTTSGTAPRPVGVFEFGYGATNTGSGGTCSESATESTRNSTMSADGSYMQGLESTAGAPTVAWDYWWVDDTSVGACHDWNFPVSSATNTTWQGYETQNGGGAH